MIVSNNRLIAIVPPWQQVYEWPATEPNCSLDYQLDIMAALVDNGSEVETVSASAAPSGTGELELSELIYENGIISICLSYGAPGRIYKIRFNVLCKDGLHFSFFVQLPINKSIVPIGPAPSPYYGTPIFT